MKFIKTASKTIIKMSRYEWLKIGRLAGWFSNMCAWCGRKTYPANATEKVIKDPNDPHYGEFDLKNEEKDEISHGICSKCAEKFFPEEYKEDPSKFSEPIEQKTV